MIASRMERIRLRKKEKEDLLAEIDSLKKNLKEAEASFTDQLRKVSSFFKHEKRVKNNRAMKIIKILLETEPRNGRIYLDSAEGREILECYMETEYELADVSNPYKAVIDVFNRVIDYAKEYGLPITMGKTIGKKMWHLTYEPAKNVQPPISALKSISENIMSVVKRTVKKGKKEVQRWHVNYTPFFREFDAENTG